MNLPHHVRARAPLRLGLAGGGTDIYEYFSQHTGIVINAAIAKFAFCEIIRGGDSFRINALDQVSEVQLDLSEAVSQDLSTSSHPLHVAVYQRVVKSFNENTPFPCIIKTYCDAPPGSGLGSSSALVVAMLKAFSELLNLGFDEYEIAEISYEIERNDCSIAGGKQDQYAASFGGFNYIEFTQSSCIVHPLRVKNWFLHELESSLVLYSTGTSRFSGRIIQDQLSAVHSKSISSLAPFHMLKENALKMKVALLRCNQAGIADALNQGWKAKASSSSLITSLEIDDAFKVARKSGAIAGKVSGAGGGGHILFMCEPSSAMMLRTGLAQLGGKSSFVTFFSQGVQSWTL